MTGPVTHGTCLEATSDGFLPHQRKIELSLGGGALEGLRFAVKDNIDVAGECTGLGSPAWSVGVKRSVSCAPAVEQLLAQGASLAGKTSMDELAFSLIGANPHFPLVRNPATPNRFAGGSSTGSAAVVAEGLVDFSMGTDTAGSVRVPASNCGIYGLRTSHGLVSMEGVAPLAQSFDALGWFAASLQTLLDVTTVLIDRTGQPELMAGAVLMQLVFDRLDPSLRALVDTRLAQAFPDFGPPPPDVFKNLPPLSACAQAFRTLQAREAWDQFGVWFETVEPGAIASDVAERLRFGQTVTNDQLAQAEALRLKITTVLEDVLQTSGTLVLPTVLRAAPLLGASQDELLAYRKAVLESTCLASLAGLPELSVPLVSTPDLRVGLSFIGPRGSDIALLERVLSLSRYSSDQ